MRLIHRKTPLGAGNSMANESQCFNFSYYYNILGTIMKVNNY